MIVGSFTFLAGALAQWRIRGHGVPVPIVVAVVAGVLVAMPLALRSTIPTADRVELFELDQIPALTIAFPEGPIEIVDNDPAHGDVYSRPLHRDFWSVELSWGPFVTTPSPLDTIYRDAHPRISAHPHSSSLMWHCTADGPVFELSVNLRESHDSDRLLRRIADSVHCR